MRVRRAQVKKSEDTISAPSDELLSVLAKVRDARASREHSARTAEDLATGLQKLARLTAELRTAIFTDCKFIFIIRNFSRFNISLFNAKVARNENKTNA